VHKGEGDDDDDDDDNNNKIQWVLLNSTCAYYKDSTNTQNTKAI